MGTETTATAVATAVFLMYSSLTMATNSGHDGSESTDDDFKQKRLRGFRVLIFFPSQKRYAGYPYSFLRESV